MTAWPFCWTVAYNSSTRQPSFSRGPRNLFVASFIGSPPMNLAHAEIVSGQIHFGPYRIPLPPGAPSHEGPVILGIRPTDMALTRNDFEHAAVLEVTVDLIERLGAEILLEFPVDVPRVVTDGAKATTSDGDDHQLLVDDSRARFVTQLRGDVQVTVGRPLEIYLNTAQLHLFDPASGVALGRS